MNMNQKGFANIILVVVILAVVTVGGYFVLVKKQPQSITPTPTLGNNPQELATSDSGVVDLFIVSASESYYCHTKTVSTPAGESGVPAEPAAPSQNKQCSPENRIPSDHETVKVKKIVSYSRNPNAHYEALQEGNTYSSNFISRPAKLKYITVPRMPTGPGPEVTKENLPESGFQAIENGLYVYAFYSDGSLTKEHEVVLPGFKEGDKIRAQIHFADGNLSITEYELLK